MNRTDRLDRIAALELLSVTFTRPPEFPLHMPSAERPIVVTACFDAAVAPWVREHPSFYATVEVRAPAALCALLAEAAGAIIQRHADPG